jgi:hypothetical protein
MLCRACSMRCGPYACGGFRARCRLRTGRHVTGQRAGRRERRPDSAPDGRQRRGRAQARTCPRPSRSRTRSASSPAARRGPRRRPPPAPRRHSCTRRPRRLRPSRGRARAATWVRPAPARLPRADGAATNSCSEGDGGPLRPRPAGLAGGGHWQRADGGGHWPGHLRVGRATPGLPSREARGGATGRRGGRRGGAQTSVFTDARQELPAARPWHYAASSVRASTAQARSGRARRRRPCRPRRRAPGRARPGPRPPGPDRRSGRRARGAGRRAWSAAAASAAAPRGAATLWRTRQARPRPRFGWHRAERVARCVGTVAGTARRWPVRQQTRGLLRLSDERSRAQTSPCLLEAGDHKFCSKDGPVSPGGAAVQAPAADRTRLHQCRQPRARGMQTRRTQSAQRVWETLPRAPGTAQLHCPFRRRGFGAVREPPAARSNLVPRMRCALPAFASSAIVHACTLPAHDLK